MWFAGLLIGGLIGSLGGASSALFGAIVGAIAGAVLKSVFKSSGPPGIAPEQLTQLESKVAHIYKALEDIHHRLARLEKPADEAAQRTNAEPSGAASATATDNIGRNAGVPDVTETAAVPALAADDASREMMPLPAEPMPFEPAPARIAAARADSNPFADNPITRWIFGGNTLVRVGVVVLFFGVAFLLKYAAERDIVPIEIRLLGVALGAIALLVLGWRLRERRSGFALVLQGGGIGLMYLTVFAALKLYHLLPPTFSFVVLTAVAVFSAALAVLQDSRALAITGVVGGFLAPILTSTGGGSHVALFSFYAVLDFGILIIARYKSWRELNLVGFVFTFVIGLMWGAKYYGPELFSTTEPFLVIFFLFYVAIAIMFAWRQAPQLTHYVDGTLVFGTPLIAFGLQTALVRDMEFGAAWSAFALAAFYLSLATILYSRKKQELVLLVESFLALGVGFATLAVPLAFEGRLTSAVWAVEGAAIVWTGVRQGRPLARAFGLALQLAAGIAFIAGHAPYSETPVLNSAYLGGVMVSAAGLFCSYYLQKNSQRVTPAELTAAQALFVWGVAWWFVAGLLELDRHAPAAWWHHPQLLFFSGSCGLFLLLSRRLNWVAASYVSLAVVPLAAVVLVVMIGEPQGHKHPFAAHAWVGWCVAFALNLYSLKLNENLHESKLDWLHACGFWLLTVVLSWEVGWQIDHYVEGRRVWPLIAWALVPATLIALFATRGPGMGWPVRKFRHAYLYAGALPLVGFLVGWMLFANLTNDGNPAPLPYIPLLNPLDLAQAGALLAIATWFVAVRRLELVQAPLPTADEALKGLGVIVFIALNGVLLRTLHHYAGVPFRIDAMVHSTLVQTAFSLFWTLLALVAMIGATRRHSRALWSVGAVLLGIVILKLFFIDLANSGTVERWISFIGVGLLVIVIGYFAPVPPKAKEALA